MPSPTRVTLLASLALLCACGGRVTSRPHESMTTAGSSTQPVPVEVPPSGGSASMVPEPDPPHDLPPIGAREMPPFETPWWLWASWQDNVGRPLADQCRPGLTEEQALAAIRAYSDQSEAVAVDATQLLATIDRFRDPASDAAVKSPIVVHFFTTSDQHLGAISVIRTDTGLLFYYWVLDAECKAQRLGYFNENLEEQGCTRYMGSALWGVPDLTAERHACLPRTGFYAFQGTTTEDSCQRVPASFNGIFHYREKDELRAEIVFTDIPVPEVKRSSFGFRVDTETPKAEVSDTTECGPLTMTLWLEEPTQLRFEDQRMVCAEGNATSCLWKMQSPKVYGPLN